MIVAAGSGGCVALGRTRPGRTRLPLGSSNTSLAILLCDQTDQFDDRIRLDRVRLLCCKVLCNVRLPWNVVVRDYISLTLVGECLDECIEIGSSSVAFCADANNVLDFKLLRFMWK